MRAYHLKADQLDALRRVEIDVPRPGPGEVLVRIRAASLNYLDLLVATGRIPAASLPIVPGADGAGEVAEIGLGVERWRVGDRVIPHFLPDWIAGASTVENGRRRRGVTMPGSLAEFAVLPATGLTAMPDDLSFIEAASLPIAATTAWNALRSADIGPGSTVLLLGTGGVSLFALQFAKASGARVIMTSSSDTKLQRARAAGAHDTINYRETPDWDVAVLSLTAGRGVDSIVETGGAATFPRSLACAAIGSTVYLVGFVTGSDLAFSVFPITLKQLRIVGSFTGSVADLSSAVRAITATGLKPMIDSVKPFEDVPEAYALLARGGHMGKIAVAI